MANLFPQHHGGADLLERSKIDVLEWYAYQYGKVKMVKRLSGSFK